MASVELEIVRNGSSEFIVQALPDGSTAIFEVATKNVYSLNPSAAAAWEACASATTLSRLAAEMSRRLNKPVTEDLEADYWYTNLREPVRFAPTVERMAADGYRHFVELSPHPSLVTAVRTVAEDRGHEDLRAVGSLRRDSPRARCGCAAPTTGALIGSRGT